MAAPNLQQQNLMNQCANVAYQLGQAFGAAAALAAQIAQSSIPATLASANFSDPATPPALAGLTVADFSNFTTAITNMGTAIAVAGSGGAVTMGQAVQKLAERANQI